MKFHKDYSSIPTSSYATLQQFNDQFQLHTAIFTKKEYSQNQSKQYRKFKEKAEDLIKSINSELE